MIAPSNSSQPDAPLSRVRNQATMPMTPWAMKNAISANVRAAMPMPGSSRKKRPMPKWMTPITPVQNLLPTGTAADGVNHLHHSADHQQPRDYDHDPKGHLDRKQDREEPADDQKNAEDDCETGHASDHSSERFRANGRNRGRRRHGLTSSSLFGAMLKSQVRSPTRKLIVVTIRGS